MDTNKIYSDIFQLIHSINAYDSLIGLKIALGLDYNEVLDTNNSFTAMCSEHALPNGQSTIVYWVMINGEIIKKPIYLTSFKVKQTIDIVRRNIVDFDINVLNTRINYLGLSHDKLDKMYDYLLGYEQTNSLCGDISAYCKMMSHTGIKDPFEDLNKKDDIVKPKPKRKLNIKQSKLDVLEKEWKVDPKVTARLMRARTGLGKQTIKKFLNWKRL